MAALLRGKDYRAGGSTVYRLTSTESIGEGAWTVPSSIPERYNTCCCRRAAGVFSGRLRRLASTAIYKNMRNNTAADYSVQNAGVQGVQAVSTPQPGRQNNHKRQSAGRFSGVSKLSRLKSNPSHVHAGARSHTHARNRCAQQPGQPGHPQVLNIERQRKSFSGVFRCPPPQNGQPGHLGHLQLRWSV